MPETKSLRPCPFCRGKAVIVREGTVKQSRQIACDECGALLETNEVWQEPAWNTRPTEAALQAEVDTLKDACFDYQKGVDALVEAAQNMLNNAATDPDDLPENSWYNDCEALKAAIAQAGGQRV